MDSILLLKELWDKVTFTVGFNPYYIGFYSLIHKPYSFTIEEGKFQSLFYWILFSYIRPQGDYEASKDVFQSLFYWILFSYKINVV